MTPDIGDRRIPPPPAAVPELLSKPNLLKWNIFTYAIKQIVTYLKLQTNFLQADVYTNFNRRGH